MAGPSRDLLDAESVSDSSDAVVEAAPSPPYFWSDQYHLKFQSYGLPSGRHRCQVVEGSPEERRFVAIYTDKHGGVCAVVGA